MKKRTSCLMSVILIVTMICCSACGRENVSETMPGAETKHAAETVPVEETVPVVETVTAAEPIPAAEPVPAAETVSAAEAETESIAETDPIAEAKPLPSCLSAQTFTLNGDISFAVSDSERYSEEDILAAAAALLSDEYFGWKIRSLSYDESAQEALMEADSVEKIAQETVVFTAQIEPTTKGRIYSKYFKDGYSSTPEVDDELEAVISAYLQSRLSDYNESYSPEVSGLTLSDQAAEECETWLHLLGEWEKGFSRGFQNIASDARILSVTECGDEIVVALNEWLSIQYGEKAEMGSGEEHLLALKRDGDGYVLMHDYCIYIRTDENFEGIENYVSDDLWDEIYVMAFDEEANQWYVYWPFKVG